MQKVHVHVNLAQGLAHRFSSGSLWASSLTMWLDKGSPLWGTPFCFYSVGSSLVLPGARELGWGDGSNGRWSRSRWQHGVWLRRWRVEDAGWMDGWLEWGRVGWGVTGETLTIPWVMSQLSMGWSSALSSLALSWINNREHLTHVRPYTVQTPFNVLWHYTSTDLIRKTTQTKKAMRISTAVQKRTLNSRDSK